ncbi:MAG: patatin-like phospholipase family protein [Thermoleophilia bacterium]|nr:patatin-like phospholipase family protein [Thermoleophilia bacterium]
MARWWIGTRAEGRKRDTARERVAAFLVGALSVLAGYLAGRRGGRKEGETVAPASALAEQGMPAHGEGEPSPPPVGGEPTLGIALSGGGFRAAFFHVGVLAYLAERRLLKKVSVLSTVSGGSIVGTLLYFRWLKKCEQIADGETALDDVDYCELVTTVAHELQGAVKKNVRARALLNPVKNFDMLARPDYSRSDRIGDLYDRYFYKHVAQGAPVPWWRITAFEKQVQLRELVPAPTLKTKPPRLVLNATCLNTGHGWRFHPERMGEPPVRPGTSRFDRNTRLAWGFLVDGEERPPITSVQSDFPLGLAVAAAAAFPVLTSPLPITGLYDGFRVRLMDGGAHDNQGIAALRSEKCSAMIVSDGAGQLEDKRAPWSFLPLFAQRIVAVYGDRVREEQLVQREWSGRNGLVHLRAGLGGGVKWPLDDQGNPIENPSEPPGDSEQDTDIGIARRAQEGLAGIRTDLDAFHDVESTSLMLCGYRLAHKELAGQDFGFGPVEPIQHEWAFESAAALVSNPSRQYLRKLDVAGSTLFKGLMLAFGRWLTVFLGLLGAGLLVYVLWRHGLGRVAVGQAAKTLGVALVLALAPWAVGQLTGLAFTPLVLRDRLARPGWRASARIAPVALAALAGVVLVAAAYVFDERFASWIGFGAGSARAAAIAAGLFLSLPLAACVLSVVWLLDGRLYLRLGRARWA